MWNLSNFTEWIIQAICSFIVLCVMIVLLFPEKKKVIKERVVVPSNNVGGRRRRINSLLALEPEEVKYEEDYIEVTVTKPEPPPKPETSPKIIEEAIGCICYMGFKKTEAKKAVNRVCNDRVFTDAEELIKATLDRSNV